MFPVVGYRCVALRYVASCVFATLIYVDRCQILLFVAVIVIVHSFAFVASFTLSFALRYVVAFTLFESLLLVTTLLLLLVIVITLLLSSIFSTIVTLLLSLRSLRCCYRYVVVVRYVVVHPHVDSLLLFVTPLIVIRYR